MIGVWVAEETADLDSDQEELLQSPGIDAAEDPTGAQIAYQQTGVVVEIEVDKCLEQVDVAGIIDEVVVVHQAEGELQKQLQYSVAAAAAVSGMTDEIFD